MRTFAIFFLVALGTLIVDQNIKTLFLEGYYREGSCIDLSLHFNKGVAFSLFAFMGPYLKWLQLLLIGAMLFYIFTQGYLKRYAFPLGLLLGGAVGNLYDRFVHQGVVDYVAWHCGFEFAVFNYADVMIDLGVALILLRSYLEYRNEKKANAL